MAFNVLSLFDGISCLQVALRRAGIPIGAYYASEINSYAINVTQDNFPLTIQLGDVNTINWDSLPKIDLLAGGSPCQDISNLNKKREGLNGKNSSLFWKFVDAKNKLQSKNSNLYWLLENVRGTATKEISRHLGVRRPNYLNSNLIVPQDRNRCYWTNIPLNTIPMRKRSVLSDLLESSPSDEYYLNASWLTWWSNNKEFQLNKGYSRLNPDRAACLTKRMYASWNGNFIEDSKGIRKLTRNECERLQTLPDNYTKCIPLKHAYEALGNCWTVDIVTHILNHIPRKNA